MKGIELICDQIVKDAQVNAAEILKDARARARTVTDEAEKQAAEICKAGEERANRQREDIMEKARLNAELSTRMRVSAEKQKLVSRVFDHAREKLLNLPDEEYLALLAALLRQVASDGLGGEILLNRRDRDRLGPAVVKIAKEIEGEALSLSKEVAPIQGGLVLRRGKIEYNCAIEELVRAMVEEKSYAVTQALFA